MGSMANAAVFVWIGVWVFFSVSIILVNKHLLYYTAFKFPFALAFWHMVLGSIVSRFWMLVTRTPDAFKEASRKVHIQLGITGVLFAAVLVTGNAALLYLTVPTVQMLKASQPTVIYLIGMVMGTENYSFLQSVKVLVVCLGVTISSYGDISLVFVGLIIQIFSILMDASRCCYLQRVLQMADIKATPLVTLAHVAPFSAAALLLPTIYLEVPRVIESMPQWHGVLHWVLLSGVLASCLNLVIFKLIAMTSALTTSLSGVIKEWVCILVAMYVYSTKVTFLQWFGYGIAISGLVWYQVGKIYAQELVVSRGTSKLPVFEKTPQLAVRSPSGSSSGKQTPLLAGCDSPCSDQEAGEQLLVAKQNSD
eukprot:gene3891-4145_t